MVGHQAIRVQGNATPGCIVPKTIEIKLAIFITKEYRLTIDATLDDVLRQARKLIPGSAGHAYLARATG